MIPGTELITEYYRTPCLTVASAIVGRSLKLSALSAAYMVEACHFFDIATSDLYKSATWHHLERLSLTSREIQFSQDKTSAVKQLLVAAAQATMRMPRLHVLKIWFANVDAPGIRRGAFVFLYNRTQSEAYISWTGDWSVTLDPAVSSAWAVVAERSRVPLRINGAVLDAEIANCHGLNIKALQLQSPVIHRASLLEMCRETEGYDKLAANCLIGATNE